MTWWNVNLDGVALINLIMCIGFSVDFSAHICYHYMSEDDKTPEERISASLYALGMPIVQGACSTILGVFGLAFAPSYLYITFFKMVFLVIFLGAAHGLILLPVLLSLFGPGSCGESKSSRRSAISTPSTTVSVHSTKLSSCYTVSLGLGPADLRRKHHEPTLEHFQKRRSDEFPSFPSSEFHPDRFTFVAGGRIPDESLVQGVPPPRAGIKIFIITITIIITTTTSISITSIIIITIIIHVQSNRASLPCLSPRSRPPREAEGASPTTHSW